MFDYSKGGQDMIDIHNHLLHGLDDGPSTIEESIQMCRAGSRDGIRTIVASPHTLNGFYQNDRLKIQDKLRELNDALVPFSMKGNGLKKNSPEMQIDILPGADVYLCEKTLQQMDRGELMTIGDRGRFLLLEFPSQGIPHGTENVLAQLIKRGVTPIISHPERNLEIGLRPQRYFGMIRMGCLGQVTAMSLTGGFGPGPRRAAKKLLEKGVLHFIASDAHSMNGRPPVLSSAVIEAGKIIGKERARKMVTEYPQAILEGVRPKIH